MRGVQSACAVPIFKTIAYQYESRMRGAKIRMRGAKTRMRSVQKRMLLLLPLLLLQYSLKAMRLSRNYDIIRPKELHDSQQSINLRHADLP